MGNIVYAEDVLQEGFNARELRFFLICNHYRERINFTYEKMAQAAAALRETRSLVKNISVRLGRGSSASKTGPAARKEKADGPGKLALAFQSQMDSDLNVKAAFGALRNVLAGIDPLSIDAKESAGCLKVLKKIDEVLGVLF